MSEDADAAHRHLPTSRRAVMLEQVSQRLKEQFIVGLGESSIFSEERRDKPMGTIEGVRNRVFPAHLTAGGFLLAVVDIGGAVRITGIRESNPSDGVLMRE